MRDSVTSNSVLSGRGSLASSGVGSAVVKKESLQKSLSPTTILLITINSIVGSGLFFLPAIGAAVAGPASIISWIILSLVSIYAAAVFGELVSIFPTSGGIYEFSKEAYGTFVSFLMGWVAWLVGNVTTAMLIVGAVTYLLPHDSELLLFAKIGLSIFWVLLLNFMAYRGLKTSAVMLVSFAIVTIGVVLFLTIPSLIDVSALVHGSLTTPMKLSNLTPFFIKNSFFENFVSIIVAVFLISEAFFGIESVCFLAGETKNPEKVLPKTLVWATVIISLLTITLVVGSLAVINWKIFSGLEPLTGEAASLFGSRVEAPYAYLAWLLFGNIGMKVVVLGTYLVIIGAAAGWIVTGPRLVLSLAEDRLFPPQLAEIHPKYKTPYKAIFFQTITTIIFILLAMFGGENGYRTLLEILVPLVLLMMASVVVIVPLLRKKKPHLKRPFKVWAGRFGPWLLALFYFLLVAIWFYEDPHESFYILRLAFSFIGLGIPIFLLMSFMFNPDVIITLTESLASLSLWLENITLPKKIRNEILLILRDLTAKKVFDYGAGVGTLTLLLAEKVGPNGKVIASDLSHKNIKIIERRLRKKGFKHVRLLHDPHQVNRIHPSIKEVDYVVSVGMISYIQDLDKVLKELHKSMNPNGKICFVEYIDYFKVLPNPEWLRDVDKLREVFEKNGFSVTIAKLKGVFWNYLFIYGEKNSGKRRLPFI